MKDPVNDAARKRQRGKVTTEGGAGDVTGAPTRNGKYMHTIDGGNDQRRPEDGPTGLKGKFKAWPGMGG